MRVRAERAAPAGALLLVAMLLNGPAAVADGPQAGPLGDACRETAPAAACDPLAQLGPTCRIVLSDPFCRGVDHTIERAEPTITAVDETAADALRSLYAETRLTGTDGTPGDGFGGAVALEGDRIVVGAPHEDDGRGAVYVFEADGQDGHQKTRLVAPLRDTRDAFGYSVGVAGDLIVVGAPGDGEERGAIYVFEPTSLNDYTATRVVATDGGIYDGFGHDVAVSGDRVVVGAPYQDSAGRLAGAAYVFTRGADGTYSETKLIASDGQAGDGFGFSVAVAADRVLVGAPLVADQQGAAYVYEPDGSGGYAETLLLASDHTAGAYFGGSVALDGGLLVIGAEGADAGRGAAYVVDSDGHGETKLAHPTGGTGTAFGVDVAVDSDRVVVGAFGEDSARGAVYLFDVDGAEFRATRIVASDSHVGAWFGFQVGIQETRVLSGSPGIDGAPSAAYLHDVSDPLFGVL